MITIKRIKLNNFLSHKETELLFDDNEKLLIDGKSGSGKSSVAEAIIWALYGVARTDNRNLVKHGSKMATVVLVLKEGDKEYKIERKTTDKAKNSLDLYVSEPGGKFKPAPVAGMREGQEWIEKNITRASYPLFINSVAYPQDNINSFVRQTATKRKDLLLEIIGVNNFDSYYNNARDFLTSRNEEKVRLSSSLASVRLLANEKASSVVDEVAFTVKIDQADTIKIAKKEELEEINAKISDINNSEKEISLLVARQKSLEKEKENLDIKNLNNEMAIKGCESINLETAKEELNILLKKEEEKKAISEKMDKDYERMMKLNSLIADKPQERDYTKEIAEINKMLIPLLKQTDTCPAGDKCPFITPILGQIAYYEGQIKEKQAESLSTQVKLAEYQQKVAGLYKSEVTEEERLRYRGLVEETKTIDKVKNRVAAAEGQKERMPELLKTRIEIADSLKNIYADLMIAEDKITEIKKNTGSLVGLKNKKVSVEKDISDIEYDIANWQVAINLSQKARTDINKYNSDAVEIESKLRALNEEMESLSLIKEAFGSKGLKAVAVDYLIPRLEEKINEILSRLSDFRVRLDTQKATASADGITEGLFINIINDMGEELDFANYSGGERLKITVAIAEALASLQKIGFRILDELFIGLDEESTEHFADVVNKLNERFKQMICISHLRNIKDIFDKKVEVKKVNGTSIVQK